MKALSERTQKPTQFALLLLVGMAGCTAPIRVQSIEPSPPAIAGVSRGQAHFQTPEHSPLKRKETIAQWIASIAEIESAIAGGEESLIPLYNYQVGRLIEGLVRADLGPWQKDPLSLSGQAGTFQLAWSDPENVLRKDRLLVPVDTLRFVGSEAGPPAIRKGIGAPIIVESPTRLDLKHFDAERDRFINRYQTSTVVVQVADDVARIRLFDPYSTRTIRFGSEMRPLAADFTSVASLSVSRDRVDKLGFARLINPSRYAATTNLFMVQPYDPQRIPVLLVHGLDSSAATWLPLYRELMRDPEIRQNYQFWLFSYPSGYPYPYSASLLRKDLDRVRNQHPDHRDLVIAGHSMGGVISRLMLLDPGDSIWKDYFGTPPRQTPLGGESRQILESALVFKPRPNIARAVFISAPHRGSELAVDWIGRLGSRLVRTPALFADIRNTMVNLLTADEAAQHLTQEANSIDTLAPDDRFVLATKDLPIIDGVPFHSIMGNRGKAGPKEESSDGVVPYWSSHLDGAESELLVPSGHSAHRNPEGIEEVHRILRLHIGE